MATLPYVEAATAALPVWGMPSATFDTGRRISPPAAPKVAYLTNVYPKTSHSFIRNEIAALERGGMAVERLTIRRSNDDFSDALDMAEADRTVSLLDGNRAGIGLGILRRLCTAPAHTIAALQMAVAGRRAAGWVRSLAYFAEAAALADHLDRRGIRHVHVHFGTNPATVARLAARMAPLTYSFTVHGPDEFDAPVQLALRDKIAEAAFVVAVSNYGRGQLMRWSHPDHWAKIHVVRCAVAPSFLVQQSDDITALNGRTLVCVARLDAQKGLPLLIEACGRLAREERFRLRIIGDGEQRVMIEQMIAARGVGDQVELLGWRGPDDVRREIAHARALVLPSFAEGLPVVLMEALAMGRPVIATAIAGIPELVDATNGWLIPSGSADALADALRDVLHAEPARLQAMAAAGRERVCRLHDPDRNARQLADLLRPLSWLACPTIWLAELP